ncbi:hypothetical protein CL622_01710 [archaeon]|nr:hypothetical protein [archaeon]
MKKSLMIILLLLLPVTVSAITLPLQIEDTLGILVGGGSGDEIVVKIILWFFVFGVLFNKGTSKLFGDHKGIAVFIAVAISTLSMFYAPPWIVEFITKYVGWIIVILLVLGSWWLVTWTFKSKRIRWLVLGIGLMTWFGARFFIIPNNYLGFERFLQEFYNIGTISAWVAGIIGLVLLILAIKTPLHTQEQRARIEQNRADARAKSREATRD